MANARRQSESEAARRALVTESERVTPGRAQSHLQSTRRVQRLRCSVVAAGVLCGTMASFGALPAGMTTS